MYGKIQDTARAISPFFRWFAWASFIVSIAALQGFLIMRARMSYNHEYRLKMMEDEFRRAKEEVLADHAGFEERLSNIESIVFVEVIPKTERMQRPITSAEAWQRNRDAAFSKRITALERRLLELTR